MASEQPVGYVCDGCGRLVRDPEQDMQKLREDNFLSCCPERKMLPVYTRPAPAATNTGLETLSVELTPSGHPYMKSDQEGDYVTRSQAEELLAAERAKTERWHKKAMDAGVIVHSDGTTSHPMRKDLDDLKADNAAQAARIKEMEADLKTYQDGTADLVNEKIDAEFKAVDLEAKLAAAEKALKPFADHANDRAVDDTGWRDKETVKIVVSIGDLRKARAVLRERE